VPIKISKYFRTLLELEQYKKSNRSKSIAAGDDGGRRTRNKEKFCRLARALYAYISNGDNQLSFLEGDVIALMGNFIFLSNTLTFIY